MGDPLRRSGPDPAVVRTAAAGPGAGSLAPGRGSAGMLGVHPAGWRRRSDFLGRSFTWLCGGALAFNLLLVLAILGLLAYNGLSYFWQRDLIQLTLADGTRVLGEVWEHEKLDALRGQAVVDGGKGEAID